MPKRPRIARIKYGELEIDVYDYNTLLKLLSLLKEDKDAKEHKVDKEHKECEAPKHVPVFSSSSSGAEPDLPSFVAGNPWLRVISKKLEGGEKCEV